MMPLCFFQIAKSGVFAIAMFSVLSGCASVGTDKFMHFGATGIISAFVTCLSEPEYSIVAGGAAGIGAGLAKEVYDSRPGGSGFDGADLLADGLGAGVGTAIGYNLCHSEAAIRN